MALIKLAHMVKPSNIEEDLVFFVMSQFDQIKDVTNSLRFNPFNRWARVYKVEGVGVPEGNEEITVWFSLATITHENVPMFDGECNGYRAYWELTPEPEPLSATFLAALKNVLAQRDDVLINH